MHFLKLQANPIAMQRVFITGASGFIGAHLCKAFSHAGWQVFAGMRSGSHCTRFQTLLLSGKEHADRPRVKMVNFDLAKPEDFLPTLVECHPDLIIHCAAVGVVSQSFSTVEAIDFNVRGTALLIEAAAHIGKQRFVHFGSAHEYGGGDQALREDAAIAPCGLYAVSKTASTLIAMERAATLDVALVVLRPFALYGPYENPSKLLPLLIEACLRRQPIDLSPGQQRRDYLYIDDFTSSVISLVGLESFPAGQVFNVCSGKSVTLRDLGSAVACECGGEQFLRWGARPYRKGEPKALVGDPTLFSGVTGWQPRVSLLEGIRRTVAVKRGDTEGV